jgi:protein SCO1/2
VTSWRSTLGLLGPLGLGILLGLLAVQVLPEAPQSQGIEWLDPSRPLPPVTLRSAEGTLNTQELRTGWTFLAFGYLNCPDVCPTTLAALADLADRLEKVPSHFIFVSVDPGRDTVSDLAAYVDYFATDFTGATAPESVLTTLTRSLGMQFSIGDGQGNYPVAHSTGVAIIGPDGRFQGRLRPEFDALDSARDIRSRHSRLQRQVVAR